MATKRNVRLPKLRNDKNRGFVELNGRRHYLGPYHRPETREAADRLLAEWLAHGRRLPTDARETTVVELCRDFLEYSEEYYRKPDGTLSSSINRAWGVENPKLLVQTRNPGCLYRFAHELL